MNILPVALVIFYKWSPSKELEVWVQVREDDGPFHGLLEFPGGGIEIYEMPLTAAVREVKEEVGIKINPSEATFMGTYANEGRNRTVLLYVFLFPDQSQLTGKGKWLLITEKELSSPYKGLIPPPNHRIIDDLFKSLYDRSHHE